MTHATDPLSQADRHAIFHPTWARWSLGAYVTLAVMGLCVLLATEHLWRPLLDEWGW